MHPLIGVPHWVNLRYARATMLMSRAGSETDIEPPRVDVAKVPIASVLSLAWFVSITRGVTSCRRFFAFTRFYQALRAFNYPSNYLLNLGDQEISLNATTMEQYDEPDRLNAFEKVESWPTIEQIERHLRKLGCTKEQVRRHLDQLAMSRIEAAKEKGRRPHHNAVDWPQTLGCTENGASSRRR